MCEEEGRCVCPPLDHPLTGGSDCAHLHGPSIRGDCRGIQGRVRRERLAVVEVRARPWDGLKASLKELHR